MVLRALLRFLFLFSSFSTALCVQAAYPAGSAAKNASLIRQSGASVLYSVDATALRLSPDTWTVWKSAGSTSGPQIWSGVPWWAGADGLAVVWQFPFTGVEEDLWGNTELLARAFASLAAAWLAAGVWRGATLYLTLCNDQFSRRVRLVVSSRDCPPHPSRRV